MRRWLPSLSSFRRQCKCCSFFSPSLSPSFLALVAFPGLAGETLEEQKEEEEAGKEERGVGICGSARRLSHSFFSLPFSFFFLPPTIYDMLVGPQEFPSPPPPPSLPEREEDEGKERKGAVKGTEEKEEEEE